jgi:hypothetical protein
MFPYIFGDDVSNKPACGPIDASGQSDTTTMRSDVWTSVLPTVARRMEKYIQTHLPHRLYFTIDELVKASRMKGPVTYEALHKLCIHPRKWIVGYTAFMHRDGVVFAPQKIQDPQTEVPIPSAGVCHEASSGEGSSVCDAAAILRSVPVSGDNLMTTLLLYMFLDSQCWSEVAQFIIQHQTEKAMHLWGTLLTRTGALIHKRELPRFATKLDAYIGYVDIFNKDEFRAFLSDPKDGRFRVATETEVRALQDRRTQWPKPTGSEHLYGIMEPFRFSKDQNAPYRTTLKLMLPGPTVAKRRGVVCSSNKKKDLQEWLRGLGHSQETENDTKDQLCFTIALHLARENRLLLYPEWKP